LANRARITALPVVRLNLLEFLDILRLPGTIGSQDSLVKEGVSETVLGWDNQMRNVYNWGSKPAALDSRPLHFRSNRAAMRGSSREGTDDLQVHSCEWVRGYLLV